MKQNKHLGRPSKLLNVDLIKVEQYAMLGLSQKEIAFLLNIDQTTLTRNKKKNITFANALIKGQLLANMSITKALYNTAMKGNVYAQTFWLCNRDKVKWQNTQKMEHTGSKENPISIICQGINLSKFPEADKKDKK